MGRSRLTKGVAFFGRNETERRGDVGIGDHDGEGFFAAALAAAELFDRGGLARVAGELIAAEAFPGNDATGAEQIGDAGEDGAGGLGRGRGSGWPVVSIVEDEARAADRAGVGLRVEAAILGVLVLAEAVGAHGEFRHGGHGAVVGNVEDDAVARAAVGAVGEGVVVAAIGGVAGVGEAGVADADVGRDEGEGGTGGIAFVDGKGGVADDGNLGAQDLGDADQRRGFGGKGGDEGFDGRGVSFDFNEDAAGGVEDEAGERVAAGEVIDVRAEADALDDAANL